MTLQNVIDFAQSNNIDLFENCTTPEPIDINLVKDYIVLRCGLLTPVYPEPELFKLQTKMWFDKMQWEFSRLVKILLSDWDIIDNIDEWDWWKEEHSGTDSRALGGTQSQSGTDLFTHGEKHELSGTDTNTYGKSQSHTGEDTDTKSGKDTDTDTTGTEHKVSAYNSSGYQADSQDSNSGSVEHGYDSSNVHSYDSAITDSGEDTTQYGKVDTASGTDSTEYGKVITDDKTDDLTHGEVIEYNRHRHGNIGVETVADIINKELDLLERFNVYDWIARKFERDNMIQVY